MQILPIQKQENPSFHGLTKALKNKIYIDGQKDIEEMLLKNPKVNQIVGQLPAYVFNKIPKELRKVAIPEIFKAFDDVSNMLRDFYHPRPWMVFDQTELNRPQEANDILTNVFQKYKIIRPYDEIDLVWLGKGGRGKAYPLTDETLMNILNAKGYCIARRTVAKYREMLDIPVARLRKQI